MSADGIVWHFEIAEQPFPSLEVPQMTLNTQTPLSERWNRHFLQIHFGVLQCSHMATYNFPSLFHLQHNNNFVANKRAVF